MKKLFLILAMVLIPVFCFSATKTLVATWQQTLPSPNDLAGWRLYKATAAGGPYTLERTINYVSAQTTYTDSFPIIVPDNTVTTLYFVLRAFDTSANESANSNEAMVRLDFESPGVPIIFTITVTTP